MFAARRTQHKLACSTALDFGSWERTPLILPRDSPAFQSRALQ
jgi:hypothetical protein